LRHEDSSKQYSVDIAREILLALVRLEEDATPLGFKTLVAFTQG